MAAQRAQLQDAHAEEVAGLRQQLAAAKGRLAESLSSATTRQSHELRSLREQQEEFDALLQVRRALLHVRKFPFQPPS